MIIATLMILAVKFGGKRHSADSPFNLFAQPFIGRLNLSNLYKS
jgi:hypothetical protein